MQYPRAQTIDRKSRKREEDVLLKRAFVVMRAYNNVGLPALQEAISRILRIPLRQLRSYSCVKAFLERGL